MNRVGVVGLLLVLTSCASRNARSAVPLQGQTALQVPAAALTPEVQTVLTQVRTALAQRYAAPSDLSVKAVNQWDLDVLGPWVLVRARAVAQVRASLRAIDDDRTLQAALARWAFAWLLEDSASLLLSSPRPDAIAHNAMAEAAYADVLWKGALPAFVDPAIEQYAECAVEAGHVNETALQQRCEAGRRRLLALRADHPEKPAGGIVTGDWEPPAQTGDADAGSQAKTPESGATSGK